MTLSFRTFAMLASGSAALLLGALGASPSETTSRPPATAPGDTALNHWVFATEGVDS